MRGARLDDRRVRALSTISWFLLLTAPAAAQAFHGRPPNDYSRTADDNIATRLDDRLAAGELVLDHEPGGRGRLRALLRELGIPTSSQTLVFSRTSLQRHHIGPHNARALYFGPDAYVGWIPGAKALEVAVGDDRLGLVFYTLSQDPAAPARLCRDDSCLRCHASPRTDDEPGLLLRSVFPDPDGEPITSAGETLMDHRAPLVERWGGWLVTGAFAGDHRGNAITSRSDDGDFELVGRTARSLRAIEGMAGFEGFDASRYLADTSDIAALLTLEHQALVHNLTIRATMQVRYLLDKDAQLAELVPPTDAVPDLDGLRPTTRRIVDRLAKQLAAALLFDGEPPLDDREASSDATFDRAYRAQWPLAAGVRLGELDLTRRTMRLPLSPMVLSPAFERLPDVLRRCVLQRLDVAIGRGTPPGTARLTRDERNLLDGHLRELLPGWPPPPRRGSTSRRR